jgi:hypothetical protein
VTLVLKHVKGLVQPDRAASSVAVERPREPSASTVAVAHAPISALKWDVTDGCRPG